MITPVIHVIDYPQVQKSVEACLENGIDHVFLIDHNGLLNQRDYGPGGIMTLIITRLKHDYPELWIGMNFLTLPNDSALVLCEEYNANALWCDSANLRTKGDDADARYFNTIRDKSKNVQYFGGVEFKYQLQPKAEDLEWVYQAAMELVDVITTSGPGTGKEIRIEKLSRIRDAVGTHPIAVASGVNETNKALIEKYADYLLVATSITDPSTEIISSELLKRLIHS